MVYSNSHTALDIGSWAYLELNLVGPVYDRLTPLRY